MKLGDVIFITFLLSDYQYIDKKPKVQMPVQGSHQAGNRGKPGKIKWSGKDRECQGTFFFKNSEMRFLNVDYLEIKNVFHLKYVVIVSSSYSCSS